MFTMSKGWERFFHLLTYVSQGPSYLNPRGYAILHRMHHAFSDTPQDPHSPRNHRGVMAMMWATKEKYDDYAYDRVQPEPRFDGGTPSWPALDKLGQSWPARFAWMGLYTAAYVKLATAPWMYALLPFHYLMGPVHGAIVNWCGHRYGYRNYDNSDDSRNTLLVDFVTLGELFQNNHHKFGMAPNFAARRFEIDPTYAVIRLLAALGVIQLASEQKMRYPERASAETAAAPTPTQAASVPAAPAPAPSSAAPMPADV